MDGSNEKSAAKTPPRLSLLGSAFTAVKNLFTPEADSRKFFNKPTNSVPIFESTSTLDISDLRKEFSDLTLSEDPNMDQGNDSASFKTSVSRIDDSFKSINSIFDEDKNQIGNLDSFGLNETVLVTTPILAINAMLTEGEQASVTTDSFVLNSTPIRNSNRSIFNHLNLQVVKNESINLLGDSYVENVDLTLNVNNLSDPKKVFNVSDNSEEKDKDEKQNLILSGSIKIQDKEQLNNEADTVKEDVFEDAVEIQQEDINVQVSQEVTVNIPTVNSPEPKVENTKLNYSSTLNAVQDVFKTQISEIVQSGCQDRKEQEVGQKLNKGAPIHKYPMEKHENIQMFEEHGNENSKDASEVLQTSVDVLIPQESNDKETESLFEQSKEPIPVTSEPQIHPKTPVATPDKVIKAENGDPVMAIKIDPTIEITTENQAAVSNTIKPVNPILNQSDEIKNSKHDEIKSVGNQTESPKVTKPQEEAHFSQSPTSETKLCLDTIPIDSINAIQSQLATVQIDVISPRKKQMETVQQSVSEVLNATPIEVAVIESPEKHLDIFEIKTPDITKSEPKTSEVSVSEVMKTIGEPVQVEAPEISIPIQNEIAAAEMKVLKVQLRDETPSETQTLMKTPEKRMSITEIEVLNVTTPEQKNLTIGASQVMRTVMTPVQEVTPEIITSIQNQITTELMETSRDDKIPIKLIKSPEKHLDITDIKTDVIKGAEQQTQEIDFSAVMETTEVQVSSPIGASQIMKAAETLDQVSVPEIITSIQNLITAAQMEIPKNKLIDITPIKSMKSPGKHLDIAKLKNDVIKSTEQQYQEVEFSAIMETTEVPVSSSIGASHIVKDAVTPDQVAAPEIITSIPNLITTEQIETPKSQVIDIIPIKSMKSPGKHLDITKLKTDVMKSTEQQTSTIEFSAVTETTEVSVPLSVGASQIVKAAVTPDQVVVPEIITSIPNLITTEQMETHKAQVIDTTPIKSLKSPEQHVDIAKLKTDAIKSTEQQNKEVEFSAIMETTEISVSPSIGTSQNESMKVAVTPDQVMAPGIITSIQNLITTDRMEAEVPVQVSKPVVDVLKLIDDAMISESEVIQKAEAKIEVPEIVKSVTPFIDKAINQTVMKSPEKRYNVAQTETLKMTTDIQEIVKTEQPLQVETSQITEPIQVIKPAEQMDAVQNKALVTIPSCAPEVLNSTESQMDIESSGSDSTQDVKIEVNQIQSPEFENQIVHIEGSNCEYPMDTTHSESLKSVEQNLDENQVKVAETIKPVEQVIEVKNNDLEPVKPPEIGQDANKAKEVLEVINSTEQQTPEVSKLVETVKIPEMINPIYEITKTELRELTKSSVDIVQTETPGGSMPDDQIEALGVLKLSSQDVDSNPINASKVTKPYVQESIYVKTPESIRSNESEKTRLPALDTSITEQLLDSYKFHMSETKKCEEFENKIQPEISISQQIINNETIKSSSTGTRTDDIEVSTGLEVSTMTNKILNVTVENTNSKIDKSHVMSPLKELQCYIEDLSGQAQSADGTFQILDQSKESVISSKSDSNFDCQIEIPTTFEETISDGLSNAMTAIKSDMQVLEKLLSPKHLNKEKDCTNDQIVGDSTFTIPSLPKNKPTEKSNESNKQLLNIAEKVGKRAKPRESVLLKFDPFFEKSEIETISSDEFLTLPEVGNNELVPIEQLSTILELSDGSSSALPNSPNDTFEQHRESNPLTDDDANYLFLNNIITERENTPPISEIRNSVNKSINKSPGILKEINQNMGLIWSNVPEEPKNFKPRQSVLFKFDPLLQDDSTIFVSSITAPKIEEIKPILTELSPPRCDEIISHKSVTPESVKEKKIEIQRLRELYLENMRKSEEQEEILNNKIMDVTNELVNTRKLIDEKEEKVQIMEKKLEKVESSHQMLKMIENEYKTTVNNLTAEQNDQSKYYAELITLADGERVILETHYANAESAVLDVFNKQDKCAISIKKLTADQAALEKKLDDLQKKKQNIDDEIVLIEESSKRECLDLEWHKSQMADEFSKDLARLRAQCRKAELNAQNLHETLEQKTTENKELALVCEDLINNKNA